MTHSIPKIIHQTWCDAHIPDDLRELQQSWLDLHPDWDYKLWTDQDNEQLIAEHYAWFLPIYEQYSDVIMQIDAVRYFILYHYGGVYVDLDFLCLRSIEPLISGKQVVLGLEPELHNSHVLAQQAQLPGNIICNAWMASQAGHPFWEFIFKKLVEYHLEPGVLEATGPYFLTRSYQAFPDKSVIHLVKPELLYPLDNQQSWDDVQQDPVSFQHIQSTAYAVHLWHGSWVAEQQTLTEALNDVGDYNLLLLERGQLSADVFVRVAQPELLKLRDAAEPLPNISCLMVTQADRIQLAQRAIRCFLQQTYPNKELIIVDDSPDSKLHDWVADLNQPSIKYYLLPAQQQSLGALRNFSVEKASGTYIAQWDDDDASMPERLTIQMSALIMMQAQACFFHRVLFWWPNRECFFTSSPRIWECSMLCTKDKVGCYPESARGEDTQFVADIVLHNRAVVLDIPELYIYMIHGNNTWDENHFDAHLRAASHLFVDEDYDALLQEIEDNTQLSSANLQRHTVVKKTNPSPTTEKLLILTPVKNSELLLSTFFENLLRLTYPHQLISIAFLEGDSCDQSYQQLQVLSKQYADEFAGIQVLQQHFDYQIKGVRSARELQPQRRSILAKCRNHLLMNTLNNEYQWVLWIDVDVIWWPEDVIQQLLAANKNIIVPHCVLRKQGNSFDLNSFQLTAEARQWDWQQHMVEGVICPPKGEGRIYLEQMRDKTLAQLDSVGGTMLLIRADLHREGLIFPAYSYHGYLETEGLAMMAKDMGYSAWGLSQLEILHAQQ